MKDDSSDWLRRNTDYKLLFENMVVNHGLKTYLILTATCILLVPKNSVVINHMLADWVNWIPAIDRLISLSHQPSKIIVWVLFSVLFSPIIFTLVNINLKAEKARNLATEKIRGAAWLSLIFTIIFILFLSADSYHLDGGKGNGVVIALVKSSVFLAIFGSFLSLSFFSSCVIFVLLLKQIVQR